MTRKELHRKILNSLGVGLAGVTSIGSACGPCYDEPETACIDPGDYRAWVASISDAQAPPSGAGAGGASSDEECPSVEEFARYARTGHVSNLDAKWVKQVPPGDASVPGDGSVSDAGLTCCYRSARVKHTSGCPGGRPFLVDGSTRLARLIDLERDDATESRGSEVGDGALREALAAAWLRSALTEHASVAAFARLSLQLLSVGAPPELVAGAHQAALDELRHAELCLARAHRTTSRRFRPGPLNVGGCLDRMTLADIVRLDVLEGCIGETLAAAVMAEQAKRARDPELARELASIADDESNHATLAFRIARWAIATGGSEIRRVVREEFAAWRPPAPRTVDPPTRIALEMATLGHLDARSHATICRSTFSEVILPLALELDNICAQRRDRSTCPPRAPSLRPAPSFSA